MFVYSLMEKNELSHPFVQVWFILFNAALTNV